MRSNREREKEKKAEPAVKKPVVKPAISSAKEPKPKVRRKVAEPNKQEDSDKLEKEPLPLNKPVLKRQNAKLKIHREIDAFSAQDDSGEEPAPAQKRRKIAKPRQQKSKTSWLS